MDYVIYDSNGLPFSGPMSEQDAKDELDRMIREHEAHDMWSVGPAWDD